MVNIHFKTISNFEEIGLTKINFRDFVIGDYKLLGYYCKDHGITKSNKCDCWPTKIEPSKEAHILGDVIYLKRFKIKDSKVEDLGDRKVRASQTSCYLTGNVKTLELTTEEVNEFIDLDLNTFEIFNHNLRCKFSEIFGYSSPNDIRTLLGSIEKSLPQYQTIARAIMGLYYINHNSNIFGLAFSPETPIDSRSSFEIKPFSRTQSYNTIRPILNYFGKTAIDQYIEDPMRFSALFSKYKSTQYSLPVIKLTEDPTTIYDLKIEDSFVYKIDLMEHMIGSEKTYPDLSFSEQDIFVNLIKSFSLEDIQYVCKLNSVSHFKILDIMIHYNTHMDLICGADGERKDLFIKFLRQFQGVYATINVAISLFKKWIDNPDATPGQFAERLAGDKLKRAGFNEERVDLFIDALDKDPIWALSIIEKPTKLKKAEINAILEKMS